MTADILDAAALIEALPVLLPAQHKTLTSPHDAIAALIHTAMSALAFRLTAVDDSSSQPVNATNVLPPEWSRNGPGNYTFRYRHEQSSLEFVIKIVKLGARTLINAIAVESDKVATLDISTNDFVSPSFFPRDLNASNDSPLIHGYISSNRVSDLMVQFKLKILQNLVPGLRKDGYTEESQSNASGSNPPQSQNPPPARPQPQAPPHAPEEPPYSPFSHIPPENPLEIGRRDLDPFPSNPFSPPSLFPHGSGDGMFVGPEHPIFGRGRGRGAFGGQGPWGGDGYLPPMGAPPGARFDPVGPATFPGFGGLGRGRRGPPGGGNMGGPDNDEFMPPGAGDSMYM